jgi:hypothetical protein
MGPAASGAGGERSRSFGAYGDVGGSGPYDDVMSAERDELRALVDALPESSVPRVMAEVRRHLAVVPDVPWPPDWFAMGEGSRSDLGRNHDDLLTEGFGR